MRTAFVITCITKYSLVKGQLPLDCLLLFPLPYAGYFPKNSVCTKIILQKQYIVSLAKFKYSKTTTFSKFQNDGWLKTHNDFLFYTTTGPKGLQIAI